MKVSFIGLGVMGYPMSGHLISKNNGLEVKVYNRSIQKTEKWVSEFNGILTKTPAEAAENSDIVFMCVGNDKDVCARLEWGAELAKKGNKLDAESSLTFDNYGLGQ